MPFLAYIHAEQPDKRPDKPPWEPNWKVWRWIVAAVFVAFGTAHTDGGLAVLLVFVIFALICRALVEESTRGSRYGVHGTLEGLRVGLRGLARAADLADVLQRGRTHLLVGGGWFEVVERADVAAHTLRLAPRSR